MKRINPDTGREFVKGDAREDGKVFLRRCPSVSCPACGALHALGVLLSRASVPERLRAGASIRDHFSFRVYYVMLEDLLLLVLHLLDAVRGDDSW